MKQVRFYPLDDTYGDEENGILVEEDENDIFVICGCCGGKFPIDEIKITKYYNSWVNFSEYIGD